MSVVAENSKIEPGSVLAALHNATEFLVFYLTGPDAAEHREAEGMKGMLAEAETAVEVAIAAIKKDRA